QQAGVLDAVAVIDPVMNRVLQRSGNAPVDYLGSAKPMGKVTAMAALMDCSDERISSIRDYAGIEHDVFLSEDEALKLFAWTAPVAAGSATTPSPANRDHKPLSTLEKYFVEQMREAKSEQEKQAVLDLIEALSDRYAIKERLLPRQGRTALANEA
ncbi:acyl-homoserine-lactone synthase, partial [Cribrihabitans sp. XS_ASV171]